MVPDDGQRSWTLNYDVGDDFGNPQEIGISQDEWMAGIFKKLRS